ncbi:hypothetical protein E1091_01285 [Micromonospora fluostatini]|uniref:Uncharacterized protein n=1 Tax=Micromonospora fluostatini TaxID=1629071 RepID=A0ABY2DLM6_9ACTN|nr:hypothetical protein E1091_01285 [Micromonospora fluostatini]
MTRACWSSDPGDPLDLCNATVGDLLAVYPEVVTALRFVLVASVVLSLGVVAAGLLVAWRRRAAEDREREEVRRVSGRARSRPAVYPVRCPSSETVVLRRTSAGGLEEVSPPDG